MVALGRSIAKSRVKISLKHVHEQLLQLLKALLPRWRRLAHHLGHLTDEVPHPLQAVVIFVIVIYPHIVEEPLVSVGEDCTRTMGQEREGSMQ